MRQWKRLVRAVRRERGAAYSLSLVIVAPLYLIAVLVMFEIGLLLIARIGVGYAAHAAARSAVVWDWADPDGPHPRRAAWSALAPFAGAGTGEAATAGPVPDEARTAAGEYAVTFANRPGAPSDASVRRKFENAAARTVVTVERVGADDPRDAVRASVKYRAPLRFPGASRFLGRGAAEYPLRASVVLPSARPRSTDGTFGIPLPAPYPGGTP